MGDGSPPMASGATGGGGNVQTQELEEHEAVDTSIKRRLIVGSICVLFIAAIFSYLIIESLAAVFHQDPATAEGEDYVPAPSDHGYGTRRRRRSTPPPPTEEPDTPASSNDTVPSTTARPNHESPEERNTTSTPKTDKTDTPQTGPPKLKDAS